MSSILGHSHPEIVKVVSDQVGHLDHLLSSFISEPVADLADLLTSLMPAPLDKTFFLNTGSETTEAALKIAKCATGKFEVIAFAASYRELLHVSSVRVLIFCSQMALLVRQPPLPSLPVVKATDLLCPVRTFLRNSLTSARYLMRRCMSRSVRLPDAKWLSLAFQTS